MSDSLIRRLFEELKVSVLEEMKAEMQVSMETAFDRSWEAALQKLSGPTTNQETRKATPPAPPLHSPPVRSKPSNNAGNRAAWGATRQVIHGALQANGGNSMTPKMIADWGAASGKQVAPSSIRTTLQKMHKAGDLRRRKDRYMLPLSLDAKAGDGESTDAVGSENVHTFRGAA